MNNINERKLFHSIPCIICDDIINKYPFKTLSYEYEYEPEKEMWENGVVELISCNYGSKNDGDNFYMGICDKCITEKYKSGSIYYLENIFIPDNNEELYDDIRKKRMRDININKLL